MSAYNFNPDVCLEVFHGIAEEIPSGVSGRDLKAIYPKIHYTQELLSDVKNSIVIVIKKAIDFIWCHYNIPKKMKRLGELEQKSPKCKAWRPTTGKVNLNSVIAKSLLERKAELMKQIESVREESAMITLYLKAISEQTKQQLEEIDSVEEKYITT